MNREHENEQALASHMLGQETDKWLTRFGKEAREIDEGMKEFVRPVYADKRRVVKRLQPKGE